MKVDDLIVGGGVAGLVAALAAQKKGRKVLLVDSADHVGGLLSSIQHASYTFDYGTHFVSATGRPNIDEVLLSSVTKEDWLKIPHVNAGSYFKGLHESSTVINALNALDSDTLNKGIGELVGVLQNSTLSAMYDNAEDQIKAVFGDVLSTHILIPALEKLYQVPASSLASNAQLLFGLSRLIIANPEVSKALKELPAFDDRIAYHSAEEGPKSPMKYYPKAGGIHQWVDQLADQIGKACFCLGQSVEQLQYQGEGIKARLSDGDVIEAERLVWTLPLFPLLRMTNSNWQPTGKPQFLSTQLMHLVIDKAPITSCHYVTNYDPVFKYFRATLYSNINHHNDHRITVEVFTQDLLSVDEIFNELVESGLIDKKSLVLFSASDFLPISFPVYTKDFLTARDDMLREAEKLPNTLLLGKARGDQFFMNDVIIDAFNRVT